MTGIEIKREIESTITSGSYPSWTIGLTDKPTIAKALHENPEYWHEWHADTEQEAKKVHNYFISKEMQTDNNNGSSGRVLNYIYIY